MSRKERLREAMDRKRVTLRGLAQLAALSCNTILKFANGADVRLSVAGRLAKALGVSAPWLAYGIDVEPLTSASALFVRVDCVLNPQSMAWVSDLRGLLPGLPVVFVRADAASVGTAHQFHQLQASNATIAG